MIKINTLEERLKYLRKNLLKLNQTEFAKKLFITQNWYTHIETGKQPLTDRTIADICREFNVSETWLRDGIGDVFVESDKRVVDEFLKTHNLNEKALTIVNGFLSLSEKERDLFVDTFYKIIKDYKVEDKPDVTLEIVSFKEDEEESIGEEYTGVPLFDIRASAGLGNYLDGSVKPRLATFKLNSRNCKADHAILINGTSMQPLICDGEVIFIKEQPEVEHNDIGVFVYDTEIYCKRLIKQGKKIILRSENTDYSDIEVNKSLEFITIGKVLL